MFKIATKQQSRLRLTIDGPAGAGKTYTNLRFAHALTSAFGGKIAFVDTERGSASKYVGECPDGVPWVFDVLELTTFSPEKYTQAIEAAGRMGYTVLVIDSLSHAWEGKDGALEIKDRQGGNNWTAWRSVTPIHNRMVDTILQSPCHVLTTMRSRMEYVQETDERGKVTIRKVGMAPIQRPGMEYELDIVCDMDWSHILTVTKSRCSAVADLKVEKPGPDFMRPVIEWLTAGAVAPVQAQVAPVTAEPSQATAPALATVPAPVVTLEDLLTQFGEDMLLAANDGKLPGTDAELAALATMLGA
jgi:hypothetical protein